MCMVRKLKNFLHTTALLHKHRTKDRDTLIEQSFIRINQLINGFAI